ncbi:MAG TPA: LysR substrate-binding domain-containing protein, partial [Hyphomicrobiales bacterium]|nr:LysR substrate-binding domain-containing protein [Hyphomicrobiales bacterium]
VAPTLDGEAYYRRCLSILTDIDEAESALRGSALAGGPRIDAHGTLIRTFLLPLLTEFAEAYPEITLQIGQGDRLVDLVHEGVDCVIRAGEPDDGGMIMRRLPDIPEQSCASPDYLRRYGAPASVDDLGGHQMIGFVSSRTGRVMPMEFQTAYGIREVILPCRVADREDNRAPGICVSDVKIYLTSPPRLDNHIHTRAASAHKISLESCNADMPLATLNMPLYI